MQEFYIDVALSRGLTRIQVDEILPEHWDIQGIPQFVIEFCTGRGFLTLTIQLEQGTWYDRNTRLPEDQFFLRYLELGPDEGSNPDYQSPLSNAELKAIGMAISNYMVVALQQYLGLFLPQYRTRTLN